MNKVNQTSFSFFSFPFSWNLTLKAGAYCSACCPSSCPTPYPSRRKEHQSPVTYRTKTKELEENELLIQNLVINGT